MATGDVIRVDIGSLGPPWAAAGREDGRGGAAWAVMDAASVLLRNRERRGPDGVSDDCPRSRLLGSGNTAGERERQ